MKSIFPTYVKVFLFAAVLFSVSSCHKEWEEPDLYTVNLSLAVQPDSVDAQNIYYYYGGMKLKMNLTVKSDGNIILDETWTDHENYHFDEGSVSLTGQVINLSSDTSLSIDDYPVIMRVYKNYQVLYEEVQTQNDYSF